MARISPSSQNMYGKVGGLSNIVSSATGGATGGGTAGASTSFFSSPGALSAMSTVGNLAATFFGHQVSKYETQRQNSEAERQYWEQKGNLERQNYREYEVQQRQWLRDSTYVQQRKQYENKLATQRSTYKGEVAVAATENLGRQLADLDARFYEDTAKDTIELETQKMNRDAIAAKKSGVAAGKVGRSVNAARNQYNQIYLATLSNKNVTKKWRIADKLGNAEAEAIRAVNAVKDIQDYIPNPVNDPLKPLAPLPVRGIMPAKKAGPSSLAMVTKAAGNIIDGVKYYRSMQPNAGQNAGPGKPQPLLPGEERRE